MADCAMGKMIASAFTVRGMSDFIAGAALTVTSGVSSFSPLLQEVASASSPRLNPVSQCRRWRSLFIDKIDLHCTCESLQACQRCPVAYRSIVESVAGL